jgi:RNA polymerase sigma-70 factor, ECF subfamily
VRVQSDEADAIAKLRAGDVRGLETLVRIYQSGALKTAYAVAHDWSLAEDAVADAFLSAFDRIEGFDVRRPFGPWFYRVVVNCTLGAIRTSKHTIPAHLVEPHLLNRADPGPGPEGHTMQRELQDTVFDALRRLSPTLRATIVLRYYLDLDERSIAETLGCRTGTVKWRLHVARGQLQTYLEDTAGTESESPAGGSCYEIRY